MSRQRLRVSVRVGGETKGSPTYYKLVEDLSRTGLGGGRIVEAGFANYRIVPLSVTVPPRPVREAGEALGGELLRQLREALGLDPRMLSGRLVVVVEGPDAANSLSRAASALQAEGYAAEPENQSQGRNLGES